MANEEAKLMTEYHKGGVAKETVTLATDADEVMGFFDDIVAKFGCYCAAQEIEIDGGDTMATHTVGLAERGWPEFVLVGIDPEIGGKLLTKLAKRESAPKLGDLIEDLSNIPMRVEAVSEDAIAAFFGQATSYRLAHGGLEIEALQLVFADQEKRWPEDEGYDARVAKVQVSLKDYHKPTFGLRR